MAEKLETEPTINNDEIVEAVLHEDDAIAVMIQQTQSFLYYLNMYKKTVGEDPKIERCLNPVQDLLESFTSEIEGTTPDPLKNDAVENKQDIKDKLKQDTTLPSMNIVENAKKSAANIYTDFALNAISNKHFDVAENLLNKAQDLHATEKAREMLEIVHEKIVQENQQKIDTEELLSLAHEAFNEEEYVFAEVLFTYLKIERNSETAKSMLKFIQALKSKQLAKAETPQQRLERSDKCCRLAVNLMLDNRFEVAETILTCLLRKNFGASAWLSKLHNKLYAADPEGLKKRNDLTKRFTMESTKTDDYIKYNIYIIMAIHAHLAWKNDIAKDFVFEAEKIMSYSYNIKTMDALCLIFPSLPA